MCQRFRPKKFRVRLYFEGTYPDIVELTCRENFINLV